MKIIIICYGLSLLLSAGMVLAEDDLWEKTKAAGNSALQDAKEIGGEVLDKTSDESKQVWKKTKQESKQAWRVGKDAGEKVWDKSKQLGGEVWDKTSDGRAGAADVAAEVKEESSDLWQDIIDWWDSL